MTYGVVWRKELGRLWMHFGIRVDRTNNELDMRVKEEETTFGVQNM